MIKKATLLAALLFFLLSSGLRAQDVNTSTVNDSAYNQFGGPGGTGYEYGVPNIADSDPNNWANVSAENNDYQWGFNATLYPFSNENGIYYVGFYISSVTDTAALDSAVEVSSMFFYADQPPSIVESDIYTSTLYSAFVQNEDGTYSGNVWIQTTLGNTFNGVEFSLEGDQIGPSGGNLDSVHVNYGYALIIPPGDSSPYSQFVLPVTLTQLTVSLDAKEMPVLDWTTSSEQNASYFGVERSMDGYHFSQIGEVEAHGTTSIPHDYNFTDVNALQGTDYYRLRMVDLDGRYSYSKIVSLSIGGGALGLVVAPNPIQHSATLKFNVNGTGTYLMDMVNMSGQVVKSLLVNIGSRQQDVPFTRDASMPAGIYILHAVNIATGESYTKKILLQ